MTSMKISIGSSSGTRCAFWDTEIEVTICIGVRGELEGVGRKGGIYHPFTDSCSSSVVFQLEKIFKCNFLYSSSCYHSQPCSITYSEINRMRNRERNILSSNWHGGTSALTTDYNFFLICIKVQKIETHCFTHLAVTKFPY